MSSTSNLFVDEQHATVVAKRKEDDAATVAYVTATTAHREQEALIIVVAILRMTLDEARARECTTALGWEKEKTIACHLEQHLIIIQGITIP
jgi:hypothetical protein